MSELRWDPILGHWVIIAADRDGRPHDVWLAERQRDDEGDCPFCPGNEASTTPEVLATGRPPGGQPDQPPWRIRVFANKYPALVPAGEVRQQSGDLYRCLSGVGVHEVVVHSPEHGDELAQLGPEKLEALLAVFCRRLNDLYQDPRLRYTAIICNQGAAAGATQAHPHSQIIATPVVPPAVQRKVRRCLDHLARRERCLYCDVLADAGRTGDRVVLENEHFAAFTPYASRFPFELMVLPRRHRSRMTDMSAAERMALAEVLDLTSRLVKVELGDPPVNLAFFSSPSDDGQDASLRQSLEAGFHWHLELTPRLTRVAGFETGTGMFINTTAPERAAERLRDLVRKI